MGFNDPPVIMLVTVVASSAWTTAVAGASSAGSATSSCWASSGFLWRAPAPGCCALRAAGLGLYPIATLAVAFVAFAVAGVLTEAP